MTAQIKKAIKTDKFARVSAVLLRDKRLSCRDKMVYVALCDFQDCTGRCWPSVAKLCDLSSLGKTAVHEGLLVLEALGYIERIQRHATSNLYRLYDIPLCDFIQSGEDEDSTPNGELTPPDEQTEAPSSDYFRFDSRTGRLRMANSPCPLDGDKEEQGIDLLIRKWKSALPENPSGTDKPAKRKAFGYFLRSENIAPSTIDNVIAMVQKSEFLKGRNEKGWYASLFWCLKNREKILSGTYTTFGRHDTGNVIEM